MPKHRRSRLTMSPESVVEVLTDCRGDIAMAAHLFHTSWRDLDSFIRRCPEAQHRIAVIEQAKVDPEYAKLSDEQFALHLESLTKHYELTGLQVIHEIATSKATSAAAREVKLRAAMQLRRKGAGAGGLKAQPVTFAGVLEELALDYNASAPRIAEIRQTTTRVLLESPADTKAPDRRRTLDVEAPERPGGASDRSD